jgi:hypothetical protein
VLIASSAGLPSAVPTKEDDRHPFIGVFAHDAVMVRATGSALDRPG